MPDEGGRRDWVREWFTAHGWAPFPFLEEVWRSYLAGESGLVHAATGTGKTYAALMGPILEWLGNDPALRGPAAPLTVLWVAPLRALAGDTEAAIRAPVEDLGLPWTVESRTGDTPARIRARQRERLPSVLVPTPESLSLPLTREDPAALFEHLELVVVDEDLGVECLDSPAFLPPFVRRHEAAPRTAPLLRGGKADGGAARVRQLHRNGYGDAGGGRADVRGGGR